MPMEPQIKWVIMDEIKYLEFFPPKTHLSLNFRSHGKKESFKHLTIYNVLIV